MRKCPRRESRHRSDKANQKEREQLQLLALLLVGFVRILLTNAASRQWAHQWVHHRLIFLVTWETLANQVVRCYCEITFLQGHIGTEAVEEGQLEVGGLTKCAVRANFHTVATEDTAIEGESIAFEITLGHHQRASWADLDTGTTGDTVGIMQADVKGRGNDSVEALTKHAVAIRANDIVADTYTLGAVDTLIRVTQDEAV